MKSRRIFPPLFLAVSLLLSAFPATAQAFDQYGGYTGVRGTATGYFHTEKLGNEWWLVTPEGNGFFVLSVSLVTWVGGPKDEAGLQYTDYATLKYAIGQGPTDGFTDVQSRWAYYARERLRRWGFNTIGTFSHPPVTIDFSIDPPRYPATGSLAPNYLPQIITKRSGGYAMRDGGVKNLYGPLWGLAGGSSPYFPDVFDPAFAASVEQDAQTGSWRDSPWVVYVFMDQTDEMRGVSADHSHLGFIAAATAPTMASDPNAFGGAKTYPDPTMYTKLALRDFLQATYGTIGALNVAWGTAYSTWDSAGGWGVGTGFLDENGANLGNWKASDPDKPGFPSVRQDLDAFATRIMRQWYRTVFEAYRRHKPNHLLATNDMGTPKLYVYEGLRSEDKTQVYADLIFASSDPDAGMWADRLQRPFIGKLGGFLTGENDSPLGYEGQVEAAEFDDAGRRVIITAFGVRFWWAGSPEYKLAHYVVTQFSSLPPVVVRGETSSPQFYRTGATDWLGFNKFAVQQFSFFNGTYEELKAAIKPGDTFRRVVFFHPAGPFEQQESRGAQFAADLGAAASRRSPAGVRFVVGANHWAWPDTGWLNYFEAYDFGLVTLRDNAYDGVEASFSPGTDPFGFARFPETPPPHLLGQPGFGDFLSQVAQANRDVYPSGGGGPGEASKVGCFIATAAYGSPLAPQVYLLRAFREQYLRPSGFGRQIIATYERLSPPWAAFLEDRPSLKPLVRLTLLPLIGVSYFMVHAGPLEKTLVLFLVLGAVLLVRRIARQCRPVVSGKLALWGVVFLLASPALLAAGQEEQPGSNGRVEFKGEVRLQRATRFALIRDPQLGQLDLYRSGEPIYAGKDPLPLGTIGAVREDALVLVLANGRTAEILPGARLPGLRELFFVRSVFLDTLRFQVHSGAPTGRLAADYSVIEIRGREATLQRQALPGEPLAGASDPAGPGPSRGPGEGPEGRANLAEVLERMPFMEVTPDTWEVPAAAIQAVGPRLGPLLAEALGSAKPSVTRRDGIALRVSTPLGAGTLDRRGFLIESVTLSRRMGLEVGDRILSVHGHSVTSLGDLYRLYLALKADSGLSTVQVVIARGTRERTLTYRLR